MAAATGRASGQSEPRNWPAVGSVPGLLLLMGLSLEAEAWPAGICLRTTLGSLAPCWDTQEALNQIWSCPYFLYLHLKCTHSRDKQKLELSNPLSSYKLECDPGTLALPFCIDSSSPEAQLSQFLGCRVEK